MRGSIAILTLALIRNDFQNIVAADTLLVQNWQKTTEFYPMVYIEPESIEEVQAIVLDNTTYPSPVRPAGNILSPSDIHQNENGTTVCFKSMVTIHGVVEENGLSLIETDPGVTLRELQIYAHEKDLELTFSAEIGLSTIGGTAFATTKDSAVGDNAVPEMGVGDVGSMIYKMTVVFSDGEARTLTVFDENGVWDMEFQGLLDSYGARGIGVRYWVVARPKTELTTSMHLLNRDDNDHQGLADTLWEMRQASLALGGGNIFASIGIDVPLVVVEDRMPTASEDRSAPFSFFLAPFFTIMKKYWIERSVIPTWGKYFGPFSGTFLLRYKQDSRSPGNAYTYDIPKDEDLLTFSYYSFDAAEFQTFVPQALDFVRDYAAETGFKPTAFAVYFVTHSNKRLAGPYYNGEGRTYSYSFDPYYPDQYDEGWYDFLHAWNIFAKANKGRPSLNQSMEIQVDPEYGGWAVYGEPDDRFVNPWLKQFFDNRPDRV